jgi:uncharacterized protein YijF (DUF1287 family)
MKRILILLALSIGLMSFRPAPSPIDSVVKHALWQTTQDVTYDGRYYKIDYPNGDVPANIGVCTDVIIRAYRSIGIDLQQLIHEDMKVAHAEYTKRRKTDKLDASIDHRRTQNIETYLTRQDASLACTTNGKDYEPGDIVFWGDIAYGHVGIVVDKKVPGTNRYYIVHNIGAGPKMEDFLFKSKITGHYRWQCCLSWNYNE